MVVNIFSLISKDWSEKVVRLGVSINASLMSLEFY